jgi:hypothetical protein
LSALGPKLGKSAALPGKAQRNKLTSTISANEFTSPLSTLQDCTQGERLELGRVDE